MGKYKRVEREGFTSSSSVPTEPGAKHTGVVRGLQAEPDTPAYVYEHLQQNTAYRAVLDARGLA